jgi:trehalose 6-phosphate phosphatase
MAEKSAMKAPILPDPASCALFLDFDGVLVDIAPRPDAVQVDAGLVPLLGRLAGRLGGRLAVVSGRPVAEIDGFLHRIAPQVVGLHGAEARGPDGTLTRLPAAPGIDRARAVLAQFAAGHPALLLEDKGIALALHWRGAPDLAPMAEAAARAALAAAGDSMVLQPGKMVAELKPAGVTKGAALARLMQDPHFARAVPVMLGDDLTDESAFAMARALGGLGVLVGPERETAATARLPDVAAVHSWLAALADG